MGDGDLHLRHQPANALGHLVEFGDARADIEHLPAAQVLAHQRLAHHHRVVGQDEGAHGEAVHRRVAMTLMSRTPLSAICRVRGIGVAVSVSTWASALSRFRRSLWATPKCCLLVHDNQAEVVERDGGAEQRVGADDDVDLAARDTALDRCLLLGPDQARELGDLHRQAGEALAEGLQMLPREQGGGGQHRDLLAGVDRVERRTQRHLGLAEAHVAADQPIHRPAGAEIADRLVDGAGLILGLDVGGSRRRRHRRGRRVPSTAARVASRAPPRGR